MICAATKVFKIILCILYTYIKNNKIRIRLSNIPNKFKNNAHPPNYSTRNCILTPSATYNIIYISVHLCPNQTDAAAADTMYDIEYT